MRRAVFAVVILCAAAGGVFFVLNRYGGQLQKNNSSLESATSSSLITEVSSTSLSAIPASETGEYHNARYTFSVSVPTGMSVREFDEGGGASTITFEDTKGGRGFQIYIAPYQGAQVSEERFRQDEPSGVRTDMENANVDGVSAAAFHSKDALLGDTSEVWLIRKGYLYEVTTLRPLEPMLQGILATWRFR